MIPWLRRRPVNPTLWRCPVSGRYHDPAVLYRTLSQAEVTVDALRAAFDLAPVTNDGSGVSEQQVAEVYTGFCAWLEQKKTPGSA